MKFQKMKKNLRIMITVLFALIFLFGEYGTAFAGTVENRKASMASPSNARTAVGTGENRKASMASPSNARTAVGTGQTLRITKQPQNQSVKLNQHAAFSVTAAGDGLTYQWQYKTKTGPWHDSTNSSAHTDTFEINATPARDGWSFQCIVTDSTGKTVTSDPATLTVICVRLSATAGSGRLLYGSQWIDSDHSGVLNNNRPVSIIIKKTTSAAYAAGTCLAFWPAADDQSVYCYLVKNSSQIILYIVFNADALHTSGWFRFSDYSETHSYNSLSEVKTITGLNLLDTSSLTNTYRMFRGCTALTSLDLSSFNTSGVTDMREMFCGCTNLTSLNLSSFNTSNAANMQKMFYGCSSLTGLSFPDSFKTSKVTDMNGMFYNCSKLTGLDLSCFNTSKVTDMADMFYSCCGLKDLSLGADFKTSRVTNMSGMFYNCSALTKLSLGSSFNTSKVTDMSRMFYGCSGLEALSLPSCFTTSRVTAMDEMFSYCMNLIVLNMSSVSAGSSTSVTDMFNRCDKLAVVTIGKKFRPSAAVFPGATAERKQAFRPCEITGDWYSKDAPGTSYTPEQMSTKAPAGTYQAYPYQYEITYVTKGTNHKDNPQYYTAYDEITLLKPTWKYHTFLGWYDNNSFTGSPVEQITRGSSGNKTFYARWRVNTYNICFKANYGSGSGTGSTKSLSLCKYGTYYYLTANGFSKTGYYFTGWNTEADGSGTSYADRQKVQNLTGIDGKTITLYAQWAKNSASITSVAKNKWNSNTITFTAKGDYTRIEIRRSTSKNGTYTKIATLTSTGSYTDSDLSAGTTYWYKVRVYKTSGGTTAYSDYSSPVSCTTGKKPSLSGKLTRVSSKNELSVKLKNSGAAVVKVLGGTNHPCTYYPNGGDCYTGRLLNSSGSAKSSITVGAGKNYTAYTQFTYTIPTQVTGHLEMDITYDGCSYTAQIYANGTVKVF